MFFHQPDAFRRTVDLFDPIVRQTPEKTPLTVEISDYLIMGKASEVMNRIILELEQKISDRH